MTERQTNKNCPECFGAALWTDDDIQWCPKCSYSAACKAQPVRRNQHERGIPEGLLKAKREAKAYLSDNPAHPGFHGIGIGDNRLRVYVDAAGDEEGIPREFGGFPVEFVVTGKIEAYETGVTK